MTLSDLRRDLQYDIIEVKGDGNCLLYAIRVAAEIVGRPLPDHVAMRASVAEADEPNAVKVDINIAKNGEWLAEEHASSIASIYRLRIIILYPPIHARVLHDTANQFTKSIVIEYNGSNHYSAVIPRAPEEYDALVERVIKYSDGGHGKAIRNSLSLPDPDAKEAEELELAKALSLVTAQQGPPSKPPSQLYSNFCFSQPLLSFILTKSRRRGERKSFLAAAMGKLNECVPFCFSSHLTFDFS
jgi:hypothetical protein